MKNMTVNELHELFLKSNGITTDSRKCGPGLIFFALKGERFDGNSFAGQALDMGCMAAVTDSEEYYDSSDSRMILVDNVLKSLQELARFHRDWLKVPVIGITGTNGKTTTKELIHAVMSKSYRTLATKGNLNNQIGVPLTLLELNESHQYAVIEMGASHPGDIMELVNISNPDYGIITNVGKAHLLGFGSFEGVKATKGELYGFLRAKGGKIFLNAENTHLTEMARGLDSINYGKPGTAGVSIQGELICCNPCLKFRWRRTECSEWHQVQTNLIGSYNLDNALAAITIGLHFGVPEEKATAAIEEYIPMNNRSQLTKTERNSLVVDAYNANPTSMQAALENFSLMEATGKMLILGDMRELGDSSQEEHARITNLIKSLGFTDVFLVGEEFRKANAATQAGFRTFIDTTEMAGFIRESAISGKTILIKGSNSMKLFTLTELL